MFLRLLDESDSKNILDLWHKCLENDTYLSAWSDASLESYVQMGNCFALFDGSEILGAIFFRSGIEEVEIDQFIVNPEQRKKGYGQSLLKAFCEHFSDFKVLLEVAGENYPAMSLYKKCGFQEFSVRKNYYSSGQDAHCFHWIKK